MTLNAWLDNWQRCSHTSRHQQRHTFLLDDQCKFQLDSINTSDVTASCVSVCSSDALLKWRNENSSSVARSDFVSFRWHKAFLDGHESVEDKPRSGRPCT